MNDADTSNVNLSTKSGAEVNVKRLGSQQKEILCWLYDRREKVHQQVDIIKSLYGDVTDSRKASVSRSISKLEDSGLVGRRKKFLMTPEDHYLIEEPCYWRQRVHFYISDVGEQFVEHDDRFPSIEPGGEDD